MSRNEFYTPDEINQQYANVAPAFIKAFQGDPWFEVSKCPDTTKPQGCSGGYSPLEIGSTCEKCQHTLQEPAYTTEAVVDKFKTHASNYPTLWYAEHVADSVALAGYASLQNTPGLLRYTYRKSPEMRAWLDENMAEDSVAWLHELFADPSKRASGNLRNFREMCEGFAERFETQTFAYCTINPRMAAVAMRDFDKKATLYEANVNVPDHRNLVQIDLS